MKRLIILAASLFVVFACRPADLVAGCEPPVIECFADLVPDGGCTLRVSWEVILPGCEEDVTAVIDIGCDVIPVENGQIVSLNCVAPGDCSFEFEMDVLDVTSDQAILIVTATDNQGNVATCEIDLCAVCPTPTPIVNAMVPTSSHTGLVVLVGLLAVLGVSVLARRKIRHYLWSV